MKRKRAWKRICAIALAAAMAITMLPTEIMAGASSDRGDGTFSNPVIYADVPDIDMIRVGDAYYMVSTTMHLSPGCPIMKSTDLVNWETVNYVYDILGDRDAMNLRNGENMYGNGQWAASLKYHNGVYYVAFNSNTTGTAYIYTTDDIEKGAWTKTELNGGFHDMSLFFDDDGKGYILYGGGEIRCAELSDDYKSVKKETEKILFNVNNEDWGGENIGSGLACEGTHILKKDGYYYVFNISWPANSVRTEICHRSKTFPSTQWENKIILKANFQNNGVSAGVAQGAVIDTPEGNWYGFLFQDHGAIGRTPVLTDCKWIDGWPMLGKDGDGKTVEEVMPIPAAGGDIKSLTKSDEFYNDAEHRVFEAGAATAQAHHEEAGSAQAAAAEVLYAGAEGAGAQAETEIQAQAETETVELIENGNFENGTDPWQKFEGDNVKLESVAEDGNADNHVLKVSGRSFLASSAMYDLSGKMQKGTEYKVSGKIKYTTGPDETVFNVTLQHGPDFQYRQDFLHINAKRDEWTPFEITYTAKDKNEEFPFMADQVYMFVERQWHAGELVAEDDLMDYYLDDVSVTYEKTTGGEGPGGDDNPGGNTDGLVIELITNGGAETGDTTGWSTTPGENPAPALEVVNTEKKSGNYSVYVSGRKGMGAGANQDISGKMVKGKTYTISGSLKYTTGPDEKEFFVTLQHGPNYEYRQNLLTIKAKRGQWVDFQGTYAPRDKDDTHAFDSSNVNIFVETPWAPTINEENDLMDYYLDDFSVTVPNENMAGDGSFNSGAGVWKAFEDSCTAEIVTGGHGGADDKCLKISRRTQSWNGAGLIFGNRMTPGNTYNLKAWVKYDAAAPAQENFTFVMKGLRGSSTDPDYSRMAFGTAKSGEWTEITGSWTMPDDANVAEDAAYPWTLYLETPDAANSTYVDYYLDDVVIEEEVPVNKEVTEPGEHDYNGSNLDLVWQWNHNPNNNNWSLTEREGWLRLKTAGKASSLLDARNTLTQRTFGPACSGTIRMDISNMQNGDVAGLGSLSFRYGYIAVKKEGNSAKLQMVDGSGNDIDTKEEKPVVKASVDCTQNIVYLKEDFNYAGNADGSGRDTVTFYYSFDGKTWNKLGDPMQMSYELVHFMGSKFAIFNYATARAGGYVDVDYFRVSDKITGTQGIDASLSAQLGAASEVKGVIGSTCTAELKLDELKAENHKNLNASISIPSDMEVEDVVFNTAAIKGNASYTVKGRRLFLTVSGDNVSFAAADKLFATIKLKVSKYVAADKTVEVKADYIRVDGGASEYDVAGCAASIQLKELETKALARKLGYGNPIMTQEFGADPYAIEYDGRVYVYMTADDYQYDGNGNVVENNYDYIRSLRVVSSNDMVNWTDHGEIKVAGADGAAKWAAHSWAPAIAYKKINGEDKFFLYFANDASGIGVLEADTPLGPWKDPIGKALLTGQTPGCAGVVWCFDPAVLVDDDGSAYIYFGGGLRDGEQMNPKTARVAKLGADMVSIEGEAKMIDAPCMFEDSGIFKYNGKYYYSYCSNFSAPHDDGYPGFGTICYMESDDPMGPFTYKGEIFDNPYVWFGIGGNNHHATFVFEGKTYFIYHAQTVSKALGIEQGYRSTHIDDISFRSDGSIKPIKGTYAGISQLRSVPAYSRIEAETIAWNAGIQVADCKEPGQPFADYNRNLTDLQDGDWTSVSQVDFGEKGAKSFQAYAASAAGGKIEIRLDSPEGALIGTLDVAATGGNTTYKLASCDVERVTGTRNVFFVFKGTGTDTIMNVDYFQFQESADKPVDPGKPADTTKLSAKISEAENLLGSLSGTAKSNLEAAIQTAKGVLEKEKVTQEEVDEAFAALEKSVEDAKNADNPVDTTKLSAKISEAENLLGKLTGTAKSNLEAAIQTAKGVLRKEKVTQEEVDAALAALTKSVEDAKVSVKPDPDLGSYVNKTFTASNGLKYKITKCTEKEKCVTLTGASKQLTKASIPATVSYSKMTFKVTAIGTGALKNQKKLASATIGSNVTTIGKEAFAGDTKLASVTIGKNVKTIGSKAFYGDKALAKIKLSGTAVKSIGKNAFANIKKTAAFTMKKDFTSKNLKYKITKCTASTKTVAVVGMAKQLTAVKIPSTVSYNGFTFQVTSIGQKAFRNQKKIKSVTVGAKVKTIGSQAFSGAKSLAKVKFSGTAVKSIGKNAFASIKKNAVFDVKNTKIAYYKKLLTKANTKNFKVK